MESASSAPLWRIVLLGGLRAEQGGAIAVTRFRSQKIAALLAYLALFPTRIHTREELADLLWPDAESEVGRTNLRTALSSLRRQLEPPGAPAGSVLVTRGHTDVYLESRAVSTDIVAFDKAIQMSSRPTTPPDEKITLLTEAVTLYRGPLLPGFYETWVLSERDRLAGLYLQALRFLTAHHEQRGALEEALNFARRAATADSFSEEVHADVIRLLMASGQPSVARRHYEDLKQRFQAEMGTDPSPVVAAMLDTKRQRSPASATPALSFGNTPATLPTPATEEAPPADRSETVPPKPPLPASRLHLPLALTPFFGREEETNRLRELFQQTETRLVTMTGPGGSGKTRLAVETARSLAERFPGGVWFVALAEMRDAERLFDVIAAALEIPRLPTASPLEQIVVTLTQRGSESGSAAVLPVLLVLDNFEQVVEKGASSVQMLLERAPMLSLLVTSRQRLLIEGEQEFVLSPLPTPQHPGSPVRLLEFPSVQLFVNRARMARPDFQLNARNAAAIAQLCARLEGVPLAIELAAAWSQMLTPLQMLERLEHRFDLLVARRRDVPGRHRSLRAAVEWGWELLSPELQDFFTRLAVFRGGWTLEAAEAVTGDNGALEHLTALREHSLILAEEETLPPAAEEIGMRFRMLETLREFAEEQIGSGEKSTASHARHYHYFLRLAETAEPFLRGPEQGIWLQRLEADHDNLRAALAWSLETDPEMTLRLGALLHRFWEVRSHVREASDWIERALAALPPETTLLRARALDQAGVFAWYIRDFGRVRARLEESIALYRSLGDNGIAAPLDHLAALPLMVEGNPAGARVLLEEALQATERSGDEAQKMEVLFSLSRAALVERDYAEAERYAEDWLQLAERVGDRSSVVGARTIRGMIIINLAEYDRSRHYFNAALTAGEGLGEKFWTSGALFGLGAIAVLENDYPAARDFLERSHAIIDTAGFDYVKHYVLEVQACLVGGEGDTHRAARLLGALEHLTNTGQIVKAPIFHGCFASHIARIRESLGEAVFAREKTAGAKLTLDEAIAHAREAALERSQETATVVH